MLHVNYVRFSGTLLTPPTLTTNSEGEREVSFVIEAHRDRAPMDGHNVYIVEPHRVVVPDTALSKLPEDLEEGDALIIEGQIARRYPDLGTPNANESYETEVHARTVRVVSRRTRNTGNR